MGTLKQSVGGGLAARLILILVGSIFVAEALIMILLAVLPQFSWWQEAILDASLLSVIVVPVLYQFVIIPLAVNIAMRKEAEERKAHIMQVLLAIRNVNQLITHETDPRHLIEMACVNMTETMGYHNAWILLLDNGGGTAMTAAAGFDGGFDEMRVRLERGEFPPCIKKAINCDETIIIDNPRDECPDCPLSAEFAGRAGLTHRLAFDGKVYGALTASVPARFAGDDEECKLLAEMAGDLAFALRKIEGIEALRASEAQYRRLFESAKDGIMILDAQTGMVIDVNPSLIEMLGFSHKQFLGKKVWELGFLKDIAANQANFLEFRGKGHFHYEDLSLEKADGRRMDVEFVSNVYQVNHQSVIQCNIRDITERKRTEEALKLFRALVDRSTDIIEVVDPKTGLFLDVNERGCLDIGYSREEFLALHVCDIDPMVNRATFTKVAEDLKKTGTLLWIGIHRRKDGSTFPVEVNIKYVQLNRDYAVAVVRDITDRKAFEEKIQASLKEKEMLLREIHHRVKNNLQVISSLIGLQSHDIRDATAIDALKKLQNRIKSMAIIHEKLYMSENLERIDFADYVSTISSNLFQVFGADQRKIKLFIHIDNLNLGLDSAMPCGIIINELLTNSLKHAFPGGRQGEIHVAMNRESDGGLVLSICDSGTGIPADIDTSKTTTLGLRLVNILTQQLGGQFEIKRENGTEFILRFKER